MRLAFAILVYCLAVSSVLADSSRPLGGLMSNFHHDHLNPNITQMNQAFLVHYGKSLAPIVGPGFVFAILSIVIGIFYGIIRLCCCLCCSKKDHKTFSLGSRMVPSVIYIVVLCWILAGCILGWVSNSKFNKGANSLAGAVTYTGDSAIGLAHTVQGALSNFTNELPADLNGILDQISGLPAISAEIVDLGNNVNGTTAQVDSIENQVRAIGGNANLTIIQNLDAQLASISAQSDTVITNIVALTNEISNNLNTVLQNSLHDINNQISNITADVDDIIQSSNQFIDAAESMVKKLDDYVDKVKGVNNKRSAASNAIYSASVVSCAVALLGFFIFKGFPFHISAGFGFVFSFLFWFSGSIHLLIALIVSDICAIQEQVITDFIPHNQAGDAINGCLNDVSLFDSLQLRDKFNFTEVYGYTHQFDGFTTFINSFNFSSIDAYLDSINGLYTYNLTAAAQNLTVQDIGWNPNYVYVALDNLNNATSPKVCTLQNYTAVNLSDYSAGAPRDRVNASKIAVDQAVLLNATAYNTLHTVQLQMIATQGSIDNLLQNITQFKHEFATVKQQMYDLRDKNVTTAVAIIQGMLDRITAFFDLGSCAFVGKAYHQVVDAVCSTMEPGVELLMGSQYMIALGLIPTIIIAEVLATRVPYPGAGDKKIHPQDDGKGYYTYDEPEKGYKSNEISLGVRSSQE